jgi:aspartate/tyrosine/aromatic aminotransferase
VWKRPWLNDPQRPWIPTEGLNDPQRRVVGMQGEVTFDEVFTRDYFDKTSWLTQEDRIEALQTRGVSGGWLVIVRDASAVKVYSWCHRWGRVRLRNTSF